MEPTGSKSAEFERRVSTRISVRVDNADFDDEYVLAGVVADGFRPPVSSGMPGHSTPPLGPFADHVHPAPAEDSPSAARPARPSSTSKRHIPEDSTASRHDLGGFLSRQSTNHSTGSAPCLPIDDGPYSGPSRPTHPYGLYRQTFRPRTASIATSSTQPLSLSDSSYSGPAGPSHPYGLYPQGTSVSVSDALAPTSIPLGFRGLPDQYQRRVGPDGEETGEIIGPYGHTEQLPPYTRYPDEAYVRPTRAVGDSPEAGRGGATIVPPVLTTPSSNIATIPGAGGIGLATRDPEFEPPDEPASPRSRRSTRSFASDDSMRRIRLDDEGISEKRKPPTKWQSWMRRKLCGVVPYWAICLTALVLVIMGTILGAVVGTLTAKEKRPPRKDMPWGPLSDTTPIPTPADLQPLPTGTFGMPLLTSQSPRQCFRDPSFSQAWNCHLVISGLHLTVTKHGDEYHASLDCNRSFTLLNNVYAYGEQPPLVPAPVTLELVKDKYEASRGPAWFKPLSYNKTVIVPEWLLSPSGSSQRRVRHVASLSERMSNFKRKGVAQRGERPWVCSWPDTFLELFIYAQQNSSFANWPSAPSISSSSSYSTTTTTTTLSTPTDSTSSPSSSTTPPTNSAPTTAVGGSYESLSPGGADSSVSIPLVGLPSQYKGHSPQVMPRHSPETSTADPSSSSPSTSTSPSDTWTSTNPFGPIDTGSSGDSTFRPPPLPYPRVVKLEERRMSTEGAPRARCTQVEIQGPGEEARLLRDEGGKPIVIEILETGGGGFGEAGASYSSSGSGSGSTAAATAQVADGEVVRRGGNQVVRELDARDWDAGDVGVAPRDGDGGSGPPDMSACGCLWFLT